MPLKEEKFKVEAWLQYAVFFQFQHPQTLAAIEHDIDQRLHRIVPRGWELNGSGDMQNCWVKFTQDEPFHKDDVAEVLRHIEGIDKAVGAFKRGLKTEAA